MYSQWLFTCSFFNELKCGEKHLLMTYVYFLMSLNYALKLLVESLFLTSLNSATTFLTIMVIDCLDFTIDNFVLSKVVLPTQLLH